MRVWRIASETAEYSADDVSGSGAYRTGGRWNSKNRHVLYCAESASLACLETLVHLGAWNLPLKRFLVAVDIPEALWKSRKAIDAESLPDAWNSFPAMQASTNFGDDWLKRKQSAVLVVPSAIVPEDAVILINPQHADSRRIKAVKLRVWRYDRRLMGN